jgi:hypothetical protein
MSTAPLALPLYAVDFFAGGGGFALGVRAPEERRCTVMSSDMSKSRRKWTGPERWQVGLSVVGVLVAIIALTVQVMQ